MILYVKHNLDKDTMRYLYSIANRYKIELQIKIQYDVFVLPPQYKSNFRAVNCFDAMQSIYKGLEKLKEHQTM